MPIHAVGRPLTGQSIPPPPPPRSPPTHRAANVKRETSRLRLCWEVESEGGGGRRRQRRGEQEMTREIRIAIDGTV